MSFTRPWVNGETRRDERVSTVLRLLSQGRVREASLGAERLVRTDFPREDALLIRAAVLRALGDSEGMEADLDAAAHLAPWDCDVNRAILQWSTRGPTEAAAERLLVGQGDDAHLALFWLRDQGRDYVVHLRRCGPDLLGWAAWTGTQPLELVCHGKGRPTCFAVAPVAGAALAAAFGSAAAIRIHDGAQSFARIDVRWRGNDHPVLVVPDRNNLQVGGGASEPNQNSGAGAPRITVVIPVYEDADATAACLESVATQSGAVNCDVVVIDDASPNPVIRDLLDSGAAAGSFALIRNASNQGFARSVNAALASIAAGDVLLLNADAVLPPDAVAHLRDTAFSDPTIGTLTPFSNNGEETSLPRAAQVNLLESREAIARIDAAAWATHGTATVDLPNGIGFCLYIRRSCLDRIGPLPELYERGYFEDVEFCLRAQEAGFRNVCATGVYVGHAGSLSFQAGKRALVVRNLRTLQERFPTYRIASAAFSKADPLRRARAAIERTLPLATPVPMLVGGGGLAGTIMERRARHLGDDGVGCLLMRWTRNGRATIAAADGGWPQSLAFDLRDAADLAALQDYLRPGARWIEVADVAACPEALLAHLTALGVPIHLLCGDLRWVLPFKPQLDLRRLLETDGAARLPRALPACILGIVPTDRLSQAFATAVYPHAVLPQTFAVGAPPGSTAQGTIGVVVPVPSPAVDRLLIALSRHIRAERLSVELVVLGGCLDDRAVMASGVAFVVGPVPEPELAVLARRFGIDGVINPFRTCFFGVVDALAGTLGVPKCYFTWPHVEDLGVPEDLILPWDCSEVEAVGRIATWSGTKL